ncbi:MAG: hypothetical protein GXP51_01715 [Deltaproteobacteria bacterium]|nr:hypothetical protein [Deltaproteobacteria bacterium]
MIESGRQFGLYVIKQVFEVGDEFTLCCAEDPFFNREVTLKIYPEEQFTHGDQLEQFEALLEKLSVLDHPSIAPIYDSGLEEGYIYYTSASYGEENLARRLAVALPEKQALQIIVELTQALDFAFSRGLGQGKLRADKIFFETDGRAVLVDFGIEFGLSRITVAGHDSASGKERRELFGSVAESLRSLGELLLQMLLGPDGNGDGRIDEQLGRIDTVEIRRLVGRLLLPEELRFSSFTEVLEELGSFDAVAEPLRVKTAAGALDEHVADPSAAADTRIDKQADRMVAEVRRLVAEKNGLQQSLDNALYERKVAANQQAERERLLVQARREIITTREEADVAWELVAGQKYDRWRPLSWAVGGFVLGFLISGSYGYYYSEQTRNELLAKLQANEELIKTATWRPAEPVSNQSPAVVAVQPGEKTAVAALPSSANDVETTESQAVERVPEAAAEVKTQQVEATLLQPEAEDPKLWWPGGNEFSVAAAIPIEQIKAALGIETKKVQGDLSETVRREILTTVQHWAESWARQDLSDYFSFYSERYRPELGRSRQEWQNMRRSRVTRPQWIKLNIDDIRVRKLGEDRIQVKMKQRYRSDYYQDKILKSINLIKEDGRWRILTERSLGMIDTPDIVGG